MSSLLSALASLVARRPRAATLAVLLAIAATIGGAVAAGGAFQDDFTVPGIESQRAQDLLEQRFPAQSGTQATVVFSARDGRLEPRTLDPALAAIGGQPGVVAVEDPFATPDRVSADGRTAYATVTYDRPADDLDGEARERLEDATAALPRSGVDVAVRRADRRRGDRRLPGRGADRAGDRDRAPALRPAQPARRAQRARRRVRRPRPRLRRADVGRGRDRRAVARTHPRGHARPRRRHRLRAAARRAPAGGAARRRTTRSRRRAAPTPPPGTPRSPRPGSCWCRSPGCS